MLLCCSAFRRVFCLSFCSPASCWFLHAPVPSSSLIFSSLCFFLLLSLSRIFHSSLSSSLSKAKEWVMEGPYPIRPWRFEGLDLADTVPYNVISLVCREGWLCNAGFARGPSRLPSVPTEVWEGFALGSLPCNCFRRNQLRIWSFQPPMSSMQAGMGKGV